MVGMSGQMYKFVLGGHHFLSETKDVLLGDFAIDTENKIIFPIDCDDGRGLHYSVSEISNLNAVTVEALNASLFGQIVSWNPFGAENGIPYPYYVFIIFEKPKGNIKVQLQGKFLLWTRKSKIFQLFL
jgi:hypothetical protein